MIFRGKIVLRQNSMLGGRLSLGLPPFVSDLEPIKKLPYLQTLTLYNSKNITNEQVEDLQKALPNLKIER